MDTVKDIEIIREMISSLLNQEIATKKLFSGYGVYCGKDMFGIICNKHFYLRAEQNLVNFLLEYGAKRWMEDCKMRLAIGLYYLIPDNILHNRDIFRYVVMKSIKQVRDNKLIKLARDKERIKFLPNLSIRYERLLAKIGVYSVDDFIGMGPELAFAKLKKFHSKDITMEAFWKLLAALKNKNFMNLTNTERLYAIKRLNVILANMGMKEVNASRYLK